MRNWKVGATAAALVFMAAIIPVAAESSANDAARDVDSGTTVPDETIAKAGVALRHVIEIRSEYSPKVAAAPTPDERIQLVKEELGRAETAVSDQGLTVDQYNDVMETAQSDPGVKERLLRATKAPD